MDTNIACVQHQPVEQERHLSHTINPTRKYKSSVAMKSNKEATKASLWMNFKANKIAPDSLRAEYRK